MKLFLIISLIFICLKNISFCNLIKVYPTGEIKDIRGFCLTSPQYVGQKITMENCLNSQSTNYTQQQWKFSLGDTNYPTLQSLNGLCAQISNNTLITFGCTEKYRSNSFLSVRYIDGAFIIKSVISQSCLQSSYKIGESPFFTYNCDGDENQKFFIDLTSKPFLPVYNQNKIPLTMSKKNYFLDSNEVNSQSGVYRGWERQLPSILVKFNDDCILTIAIGILVVWKNVDRPPSGCSPSAVLKMQKDGNLCTYVHENNPNANWCSMTQGLNGRYFNILPYGSYGKKWGLVIQSEKGSMVWGRWGESIYPDAGYNLIPGSFIDEKLDSNNKISGNLDFITNGREYLKLDYNTGLSYYIGNPTINSRKLVWSSQNSVNQLFQKYGFPLTLNIKNDSAVVTTKYFLENISKWVDVPLWSTIPKTIKGCRFVHLPILNQNDKENWGWVIQNKGLKILYGHFNSQPTMISGPNNFLIGNQNNALKPGKQVNSDVLKFVLRSDGVLEFKNIITGELLYPFSYSSVLIPTSGNGKIQCPTKQYLGYWDSENNFAVKIVGCEMYRDTCSKTDSSQCSKQGLCTQNENDKCFTYFKFLPNSYQFGQTTLVIQYGLPEIMFIGNDNLLVSNYLY
ncbi:hypothetical protein ACTFIZ_010150 [Dictyostelium cf. discoideum]